MESDLALLATISQADDFSADGPASPRDFTSPDNDSAMDVDMRAFPARPQRTLDLVKMAENAEEEIFKERATVMKKGHNSQDFQERYTNAKELMNSFLRLAATGDIYNIYRSRPVFIGRTESEIVDIPKQVLINLPSAKTAILNYLGLLIHENTNCFFSEKENPAFNINYATVQAATMKLFGDFKEIVETAPNEQLLLDVLKWCCDLSSELSEKNTSRPVTKNCRSPHNLLGLFMTCPPIKEMVDLMDIVISELLKYSPEQCMSTLFYSCRHGSHFYWIWLHIADAFPSKIVENMFTIGGEQFKAYVDTIQSKQRERAPESVLSQLHAEYKVRFESLSEVFNFLMRKGNVELQNTESLDSDVGNSENANYNIVFYFKLVTLSEDTLRYLVYQNKDLATPQNFFRGMRQILSLDKEMILRNVGYQEFGSQMILRLGLESHAVIFKALARLALDPSVTAGTGPQDSNYETIKNTIKEGAFYAMGEFINNMVVGTHSNDLLKFAEYTSISSFANGADLQFMIDNALANPNCAPHILRYLHSVSMAYSKDKAAEIVIRFIITCREPQLLHVLFAYLSTVVPFYPGLMSIVYKNIFATRELILAEPPASYDTPFLRFQRNLSFVTNIRTLLEWDLNVEESFLKNYELNPRSLTGHILTGVLSVVVSSCTEELKGSRVQNIQSMVTEVGKFMKSFVPSQISQKNVSQHKNILVKINYIHKVSLQLAYLLKVSLLTNSKESTNGLFYFEEFRNSIFIFYTDYLNQLHLAAPQRKTGMFQLFFISFITNCLTSCKEIFGEEIDVDIWKDPTIEQQKIDDDQKEYSFFESLHLMDTHQKISRLAHSGIIGQGAKHLMPPFISSDDQLIRTHIFLDAVRNICVTDSVSHDIVTTRRLAAFLVEIICHDGVAAEMLFLDWELEKEAIGKYQVVQKLYRSWILQGLLNIVAETQPCLWICLPIMKALLADILSGLLSTTNRTTTVSKQLMDRIDRWMILARKGGLIPKKFELFLDFLPHITVHEAYLIFLEIWRYFQRRTITANVVEHALEVEKGNRGGGAALLLDGYEGDLQTCRRIIQRHIAQLGYLYPKLFPINK